MPSTATTRNRLNKQGSGDNTGTWGTVLNTQALDLVDEALDGVTAITVAASNITLTSTNYTSDQARKRILRLTGSPGATRTITLPSIEKWYIVHNQTDIVQTVKAGGTGVNVPAGTITYVYCDGTDTFAPAISTVPIGTVTFYASPPLASFPPGWLKCDGAALSRTAYAALFATIGTYYGSGNGTTTFNIPTEASTFNFYYIIYAGV